MFKRALKVLLLAVLVIAAVGNAEASSARIKKVLPHFIDSQGRNSLAPSLYERDAYQMVLRKHPEQRKGIRFDVEWTAARGRDLILQIELRGKTTEVLRMPVKKTGFFSNWSPLILRDKAYQNFGDLIAWRATLWDGDKQLSEQKSFLW